jgi:cytochrome b subunit of formate dehydrogenase
MAQSAYLATVAIQDSAVLDAPRHSALVRITHWINAASFIALVVSGIGILLSHPRFYWGETGGVGSPSLFDLPLPFMLGGPSGWGRYLHFLAAWVCVLRMDRRSTFLRSKSRRSSPASEMGGGLSV